MRTSFDAYVKGAVLSAGWSLAEFADASGVTISTVYNWLREPDKMPRHALRLLHKYAGIAYEDLIERR